MKVRIITLVGKLIYFALIGGGIFLTACNSKNPEKAVKSSNLLQYESSPYLLQHAENPVNWHPWGEKALSEASERNVLMIVSIGYSSCHWCHVMAHESFEDDSTAEIMNRHFVSVKVDREERPDVDQIYMTALQLMSGQGGWPLNVVCLPDGRPVWGATYLPREKWQQALTQLAEMYRKEPAKMEEYARRLQEGISQTELVEVNREAPDFSPDDARRMFNVWAGRIDSTEGGPNRAPKFPMPVNHLFMLEYGALDHNARALEHTELTLDKMAAGGIYDQVGGGFARYSTDLYWTVPHFEKMLYDNAQLLSLYSRAYRHFGKESYLRVVRETLAWLEREMTGEHGQYYSALDADSEGEEGKFYVWSEDELRGLIPAEEWQDFTSYFDLAKGKWEGNIILTLSDSAQPNEKLERWQETLLRYREKRERPGLDDKSLTSWNALMITGLIDAARALQEKEPAAAAQWGERAAKVADWILSSQTLKEAKLYHSYRQGTPSVEGLLEDYAFGIQAFLDLFEYTSDTRYLNQSLAWLEVLDEEFLDTASGLYYTRSLRGEQLISRSLDRVDNVTPSPNSVMAHNLWRLGHLLDREETKKQATRMLNQVDKERMLNYAESYANWASLLLRLTFHSPEVVICGEEAADYYRKMQSDFYPNTLWLWSVGKSELALLKDRCIADQTTIYICENKACQLPVTTVSEAREQLIRAF